jgi:hydroxymethylglutaryl-CoA synthase
MRVGFGFVGSGLGRYAMAIGMDAAQARPGDELELTAAAGGAALVIGPEESAVATLEHCVSFTNDLPDFFRRDGQRYPEHGRRFTGQPAYFYHTQQAGERLLKDIGAEPKDFAFAVFHQPTPTFPRQVGAALGFAEAQIQPGLVVDRIGNTYSGSTLLGLAAVLDVANPGDRIACVSYGSGAGSDAFSFRVTPRILGRRRYATTVSDVLGRTIQINDYAAYLRNIGHFGRNGE